LSLGQTFTGEIEFNWDSYNDIIIKNAEIEPDDVGLFIFAFLEKDVILEVALIALAGVGVVGGIGVES